MAGWTDGVFEYHGMEMKMVEGGNDKAISDQEEAVIKLFISRMRAEELFRPGDPEDILWRIERANAVLDELVQDNAPTLRRMLVDSLERALEGLDAETLEVRRRNRLATVTLAVSPARSTLGEDRATLLIAAVAIFMGTEAHVLFKDVLQMDDDQARRVKSFAFQALVSAAQAP